MSEVKEVVTGLERLFGDLDSASADAVSDAIEMLNRLEEKCYTLQLEHECISDLVLTRGEDPNSRGYDEALALCQMVSRRALATIGAK